MKYRAMYFKDGVLRVLDQSRIPTMIEYVDCASHYDVFTAIKEGKIVGRIPVGIASAYAIALASDCIANSDGTACENWDSALLQLRCAGDFMNSVRQPSVTSFIRNVIAHAKAVVNNTPFDLGYLRACLLRYADRLCDSASAASHAIGNVGVSLFKKFNQVLVHGGHLSAFDAAPALAPLYAAKRKGIEFNVYVSEARPKLYGTRLTAWELQQADMRPIVVTDSVASWLMREKRVDFVIVQADRIASNGDVLAQSGTYSLAVACHYHKIPFYVASPLESIDLTIQNGDDFRIDVSGADDVITSGNMREVSVFNPVVDVTDAKLITALITDFGTITPVNDKNIEYAFAC